MYARYGPTATQNYWELLNEKAKNGQLESKLRDLTIQLQELLGQLKNGSPITGDQIGDLIVLVNS